MHTQLYTLFPSMYTTENLSACYTIKVLANKEHIMFVFELYIYKKHDGSLC